MMKSKLRNVRISDELWNMVAEKSSQEQMNISEWVRKLLSKAVECESLDHLQNIKQKKKLDDMHQSIDKVWASIQYLSQNNQIKIDLKIINDAVLKKHMSDL